MLTRKIFRWLALALLAYVAAAFMAKPDWSAVWRDQRRGATAAELRESRWDIAIGMLFSNIIIYFIMLSTASTLHAVGRIEITTAAEAAEALQPLAGRAAGVLFATGVVAVGFLAVPIMTTGAAYDACQAFGWKHGLHARPSEAKAFYLLIAGVTAIAVMMNFFGFNR